MDFTYHKSCSIKSFVLAEGIFYLIFPHCNVKEANDYFELKYFFLTVS